MAKREVQTAEAPRSAGPYSQGIWLPGQLVFVSGQVGVDPSTGRLASDEIVGQTRQVLDNIEAILRACGSTMADVMKVSVFLARFDDFGPINEVHKERFQAPYPARTTVQAGLGTGLLLEVDAIAVNCTS